jgi:hypothetical protein
MVAESSGQNHAGICSTTHIPCTAFLACCTLNFVEHACHKCGAAVEDGTPFCKQCGAPQIRVAGLEPQDAAVFSPIPLPANADPRALQWSKALPSAAIAGFVAAVLMLVPLGGFGIGMMAAGSLSVLLYRRRDPIAELTPGMGGRLGAVTGGFGFAMFGIFTAVEGLVFHSGGELHTALIEAVQQSAARTTDPQALQVLDYLKSPSGLALVMVMGLAVMLVAFVLFSSIGGAIAAFLVRRKPHP